VVRAFIEGWKRAFRSPALVAGVTLGMVLASAPLAIRPGGLVGTDLQGTLRTALILVNSAWATDLFASSSSPGGVALYVILGMGATVAAAYILFWVFLSGGVIDRLARGRPVGTAQFFATCGVYLVRFARLGVVVVAAYIVLFRLFRPHISNRAEFLAFLSALALVNFITDFAKIRAVVEDRRSMLGALLAALRFIRTRPISTLTLYSVNLLTAAGLAELWRAAWPDSVMVTAAPWEVFVLTVTYLLIRVIARLAFIASEVVLFQRSLAHAEYAAAPALVWPDSSAVEAIHNLPARSELQPRGSAGADRQEVSSW
jgi:hypothetical protein